MHTAHAHLFLRTPPFTLPPLKCNLPPFHPPNRIPCAATAYAADAVQLKSQLDYTKELDGRSRVNEQFRGELAGKQTAFGGDAREMQVGAWAGIGQSSGSPRAVLG